MRTLSSFGGDLVRCGCAATCHRRCKLADEAKSGTDWTADELDVVVADYFSMLAEELAARPFVKAHHRAAVVQQLGRSDGSVEYKYQNISAVLKELGLPWILGYKPAINFQRALFGAIDRQLSRQRGMVYPEHVAPPLGFLAEPESVFVGVPEATSPIKRPFGLEQLLRKFDPVERDYRNRALGEAGEGFVLAIERRTLVAADRPDLAERIRWVSKEDGDGAGFDILSFDRAGAEKLIEVKTTNGAAKTPFFLTRREFEVAEQHSTDWQLYRVHLFAQAPRIFTVKPPLPNSLRLEPETWRASIA